MTRDKRNSAKPIERLLFGSRWLLAPLNLAVAFGLLLLVIRSGPQIWSLTIEAVSPSNGEKFMNDLLALAGSVLTAGFLYIVIMNSWATYVSRADFTGNSDAALWRKSMPESELRAKQFGSLASITAVRLLDSTSKSANETHIYLMIFGAFVLSALCFTWMHLSHTGRKGHHQENEISEEKVQDK
ncbi:YqhA family protein [bacterium]|nr:YqhA family protein [bacterium]